MFRVLRRVFRLAWVSVFSELSHVYCNREYFGVEDLGVASGMFDLDSGMKEVLV